MSEEHEEKDTFWRDLILGIIIGGVIMYVIDGVRFGLM
jgi:hypothetical protein